MEYLNEYSLDTLKYLENKWGASITETETKIERAEERMENRIVRQDNNQEAAAAAKLHYDSMVSLKESLEASTADPIDLAQINSLVVEAEKAYKKALNGGVSMTEAEEGFTRTGIDFDRFQLIQMQVVYDAIVDHIDIQI